MNRKSPSSSHIWVNVVLLIFPLLQADEPRFSLPWWAWLLILLLVILLVWWWISRQTKYSPSIDEKAHEQPHPQEQPKREAEPVSIAATTPDDLKKIEGIGPKIEGLLQAAGIVTFAQLAEADPSRLLEILHAAGLRVNDPSTWPEQARLAASGDWEALQKLQESLRGGRRAA